MKKNNLLTLAFFFVYLLGFILLFLFDTPVSPRYIALSLAALLCAGIVLSRFPFGYGLCVQCFVFCAMILGSCAHFYLHFALYDLFLHTISGFLSAWGLWIWIYSPDATPSLFSSHPHTAAQPCCSAAKTPSDPSPQLHPAQASPAAKPKPDSSFFTRILLCLLGSSGIAALWEIWEFLGDTFLQFNAQMGSLTDTMTDILAALCGAGIFFLIAAYKEKRSKEKKQSTP